MKNMYLDFVQTEGIFLFAGPCVVESYDICMQTAEQLKETCISLGIPFVFKSSFTKANRTKVDSFTSIGREQALAILQRVGKELEVPLITDVHSSEDVQIASEVVDVLQIPAFLCRQTDLLLAAGHSKKWVNIKKGQFLAPEGMQFAAEKVASTGNENITLCERGTTFGYGDLVVDMRGFPAMNATGYPSVMDITHSLQRPNSSSGVTGGTPDLIETIALSSIAAGAKGIFMETHPDPSKALSDGANMLPLYQSAHLIEKMQKLKVFVSKS